jgi:predicted transcriptional regulator/PKD repeat protein
MLRPKLIVSCILLASCLLVTMGGQTPNADTATVVPEGCSVRAPDYNATFAIPVQLGYNLISVPLLQADTDILQVLDDNGGDTAWDYAMWYDPRDVSDPWKNHGTFRPPSLNDLNDVDHTMGVIVNITDAGSDSLLTVMGQLPDQVTIPLYQGKNLVGYPVIDETVTVADVKVQTGHLVTEVKNRTEDPYPDDYVLRKGEGYWLEATANCSWTLPQEGVTFGIPVSPGYNLISAPLVQPYTDILAVLDDDGGNTAWDYAMWYDPLDAADHWKNFGKFRPLALNDLNDVDHTMGVIVNITDPGSDGMLTVRGNLPVITTIPLYPGLNLVGYPALSESMTVADVKNLTGNKVDKVMNRTEVPIPDDYVLKRGEGYWLNASAPCNWTINDLVQTHPVAVAEPDYQEGAVDEVLGFTGDQSYDSDGVITGYSWDFGDGGSGSGIAVTHAYALPGDYTVRLTVTDDDGLSDDDTCSVRVSDSSAPVISNVEVVPDDPTNREVITVTCNVTDDVLVSGVRLEYLRNGTAWANVTMVHVGAVGYEAAIGPLSLNSTFFVNATDSSGNTATHSGDIIVRKARINATSEVMDPEQERETGSRVRITGTVQVEGGVDPSGLYVVALLNGEELARAQVLSNGTYVLDFVLPPLGDGENHLEIRLVDDVSGDVLELESFVLPGKHPFPLIPVLFGSAVTVGALLVLATEVGKYSLLLLIIPLYSKLRKDQVLNLYVRGQIHGYILANPGEHYNAIKRALDINNGSLAYHLNVLEKENIIKSRTSGMYKRFYPADMLIPNGGDEALSEAQRLILSRIEETPGITQKDVSRLIGISPSTVNYHINKLMELNRVRQERKGKWAKYYAVSESEGPESSDNT